MLTAQILYDMPRCDGLPDGRCPQNVNNRSVKLSQGDLMLCSACEATHFPYICSNKATTMTTKSERKKTSVAKGADKLDHVTSKDNATVDLTALPCIVCQANCTRYLSCDICNGIYDQNCSLLSRVRVRHPDVYCSTYWLGMY